jgi:hypothetical protein
MVAVSFSNQGCGACRRYARPVQRAWLATKSYCAQDQHGLVDTGQLQVGPVATEPDGIVHLTGNV